MTGLHEALARAAHAALQRQRDDGSLPQGCNGPYGDRETPVRNTGHWLVSFCAVHRFGGEERFRTAGLAAARYLASDKSRPGGATFFHRSGGRKDTCNGLVGQAWSIEALAKAAETFDAPHLSELAQQVFLLHPFDPATGLWSRVEVDGSPCPVDVTFNHQLWFAAAGAILAPLASGKVTTRVARFLERLPRNLGLHRDGLVRHLVSPGAFAARDPRLALRLWRGRRGEGDGDLHKEAGYHAFNLYALALLRRHTPDHPFWRHESFERLWGYARSDAYRQAVVHNEFAWPYNPTGIEMAFALETLEGPAARAEAEEWLGEQLRRHWDPGLPGLCANTPDPETLGARLYEAVRLPDLAVLPGIRAHLGRSRNGEGKSAGTPTSKPAERCR